MIVGACALLAACAAQPAFAGTLDRLTDAQVAARFSPRLILHADERYAPTSTDALLALGATIVTRTGALVRPAPLSPALMPVGASCSGGLPCAYAVRLGCGLSASSPCPAPTDAPRLIYARVVRRHPARGMPPGWLAHPDARMPYPGLEIVVQYWLYSLVDDWHSTPRSVAIPGAGTVRLPGINQHHEGDWEAVTVGASADRPLFVDWSAHCSGEWRPFAGATLAVGAGGERTHPVSWVALGSHANLAAPAARARAGGTATRASRRSCTSAVQALIGPVAVAALGSRLDEALGILDRAGSGAPQAFPLTLVNRTTWPMTFPGIWGGRERIDVGPAGRMLGWSPPTPTLQPLWRDPLATIFDDASRSRG